MNTKRRSRSGLFAALVCCVFILYIWMAARIPYTHDDWEWGIALGMRRFLHAEVNSRYVGNLVVVLLTRAPLLKTAAMGAVFTAIPYEAAVLTAEFMRRRQGTEDPGALKPVLFLLANALQLLTPVAVWGQTFGWVSGFANYVVSGLLLIVYFRLVMRIEDARGGRWPAAQGIAVFLFGVVIQLFLENLALYFFLVSLFLTVRSLIKKQRTGTLFLLLAGTAVGLALMFSSSIYQSLWETGKAAGDYRKLLFDKNAGFSGIVRQLAAQSYYNLLPLLVDQSGLLPSAILGAMFLCGVEKARNGKWSLVSELVFFAVHLLFAAYYLLRFLYNRYGFAVSSVQRLEDMSGNALFLLYLILVTVDLFVFFGKDKGRLSPLLGIWISPLLILAPMAAVNTIFPRSCLTGNFCYQLFLMLLIAPLWTAWKKPVRKTAAALVTAAFLVCVWHYGSVYAEIGRVGSARLALIEEAKNGEREAILFPAFAHGGYLWLPDAGQYEPAFREFYGIPQETAIAFEELPSE